jgi:xylulokinase
MTRQTFLGVDIGTSTAKALLVSESGGVLGSATRNYDIISPRPDAAEQDPRTWWEAVVSAVREVRGGAGGGREVRAVGLTGQMHSAVFMGGDGRPLRRAILWADKRAIREAEFISGKLGEHGLRGIVRNPVPAGFTAPSILWLRENEPAVYRRTKAVIQPKDFIVTMLTGLIGTDVTDASATGLLDIREGSWSGAVLDALGIPPDILAPIHPSGAAAGTLNADSASELTLSPSVPVIYGGGDQPVQAVGNGIVRPNTASLTVGTGGQILLPVSTLKEAPADGRFPIHTFRHCVSGLYYLMGATLAAGLSLKWFRGALGGGESFTALDREAQDAAPGADGLVFLPHLMGERTPHMNPHARGLFFGIDIRHGRGHFARAVMEGVAFSLREAAEAVAEASALPGELILTGGGGRSTVWARIISDVLNIPVRFPRVDEGSAYGAALLAATGSGAFRDIKEGVTEWVRYRDEVIEPRDEFRALYDDTYERYREIYRRLETDPL